MKTPERIPEAELEVMLVLWQGGRPMTVGEITKTLSETRAWKAATVHVLLDRLETRGFVVCDRSGYKHLFSPTVTEAEYRRREEHTLMQRFFGGSAKRMIASLLDADTLSDEDLEELTAMLREWKEGGENP